MSCRISDPLCAWFFDAFTREQTVTKNGIEGSGLGMSICKNIVEMMGGTITLNSEVGIGTEFTVSVELKIDEEAVETNDSDNNTGSRHINHCKR
ncbi:MAG: HAMP domain-containing sensor histidine kinase [Clostridia bacterium]|nr:HAMP domain-containing sensor histidine kinase [Clostridia bacterium]